MADVDVVLNDHLSVGVDDGPHTANRLESKMLSKSSENASGKNSFHSIFLKIPPEF